MAAKATPGPRSFSFPILSMKKPNALIDFQYMLAKIKKLTSYNNCSPKINRSSAVKTSRVLVSGSDDIF